MILNHLSLFCLGPCTSFDVSFNLDDVRVGVWCVVCWVFPREGISTSTPIHPPLPTSQGHPKPA